MKNIKDVEDASFLVFYFPEQNEPGHLKIPSVGFGDNANFEFERQRFEINPEIAQQIAEKMNLAYLPELQGDGNLCMANNAEVTPELKEVTTAKDFKIYSGFNSFI